MQLICGAMLACVCVCRYNVEVQLPTIVLPELLKGSGPDRVCRQEVHLTASRVTATNVPATVTDVVKQLDTHINGELHKKITGGDQIAKLPAGEKGPLALLPPINWLRNDSTNTTDCPGMAKTTVDEMWIDVITKVPTTSKRRMIHPFPMTIWSLDTKMREKVCASTS